MWALTHGSLEPSLFGINFLANHSNFIAFVIAPIYFISQHPFTLIVLKVLSRVLSGYMIYKIAKEKTDFKTALLFMGLYFLYPANIFSMIFEFDFESLAPALVALTFYFHLKKKYAAFCLSLFLTLLCKENMAAYAVTFGLYSLFSKDYDKIKWGMFPILTGIIYFYVVLFIITPHLRNSLSQTKNIYLGSFSWIGNSPNEVIKSIMNNPMRILQVIICPLNLNYLKELFLPIVLLPIIS